MRYFRLLFWMLVPVLLTAQAAPSPATPSPGTAPEVRQEAWEGVVGYRGKPIGTTILLQIASNGAISGWIQRNDFYPIDSGQADSEHIKFTSSGNSYDINLRTARITYSGPDGSGNQRAEKLSRAEGMIYRLIEPTDEGESTITIRDDSGDRNYLATKPAVWKRVGKPIDELEYDRFKEIVGKTVAVYLSKVGQTRYIAVLVEPEGMDLQKHPPKQKKQADKKK
jgi:hypothetical protein